MEQKPSGWMRLFNKDEAEFADTLIGSVWTTSLEAAVKTLKRQFVGKSEVAAQWRKENPPWKIGVALKTYYRFQSMIAETAKIKADLKKEVTGWR